MMTHKQHNIIIITSRYYTDLADQMTRDAQAVFSQTDCLAVSGVFELPLVTQAALKTGRYDGAICLGIVIQGETPHFNFVSDAATQGITRVSLDYTIPVAFGVLTTNTYEQAVSRVRGPKGYKGTEAAQALKISLTALDQLQHQLN